MGKQQTQISSFFGKSSISNKKNAAKKKPNLNKSNSSIEEILPPTPENERKKNIHSNSSASKTKDPDGSHSKEVKGASKETKRLILSKPTKRKFNFKDNIEEASPIKRKDENVKSREIRMIAAKDKFGMTTSNFQGNSSDVVISEKYREGYESNNQTSRKKNEDAEDYLLLFDDNLMEDLSDGDFVNFEKAPLTSIKKCDNNSSINFNDSLDNDLDLSFLEGSSKESSKLENCIAKQEEETTHVILVWSVIEITFAKYSIPKNNYQLNEKILRLKLSHQDDQIATCHLREDWFHSEVQKGDLVYVSGLAKDCLMCTLDNQSSHHLTLYPKTLISGTTIAAGISCERQAILNERFKIEQCNEAMFLGTLIHDLFDWALKSNTFSSSQLLQKARENLKLLENLESLYQLGLEEDDVLKRMKEYFQPIGQWFENFLRKGENNSIEYKSGEELHGKDSDVKLDIDDIVDIEENIWAPSFGLKGKVDVTVHVSIHKSPKLSQNKRQIEHHLLPLELKTGKMWSKAGSVEHRAQVAVYTIMMGEKYHKDISTGLLYYIKAGHMQGIPVPRQEKRAIIMKRNEIARYLNIEYKNRTLPSLIRNERLCKRCSQNRNCMLYYKSIENGTSYLSGMESLFNDLTSHLNRSHLKYFSKWYNLLLLEASYSKSTSIWEKNSIDLEKKGLCYSGMVIHSHEKTLDDILLYTFKRKEKHFNISSSLKDMSITKDDRVVISHENETVYNITTGYVDTVNDDKIIIKASHGIAQNKYLKNNFFRIDIDNTLSSLSNPLANLSKLFSINSDQDERLRQIVIDNLKPSFGEPNSHDTSGMLSTLNVAQREAVKKCLSANDYLLILGMPGSGKSTTIAHIVKVLVALGKTVLLTSYTHSAVDTILLKLLNIGFNDFVRLGQASRVHNQILPYMMSEKIKHVKNTLELQKFYQSQNVVATTSLGVNHPLFSKITFDYCIVDEASQITQPVNLGPIRHSKVFVLVGDENQLPPLVQNDEARKEGLDVSLFAHLSEVHRKDAVVPLNHQYRMNEEIMALTNHLVYNQQMKCANEKVSQARLSLPKWSSSAEHETDRKYLFLRKIIDPNHPVVYINTDNSKLLETKTASNISNQGEATIVTLILKQLNQYGVQLNDVGVITPYRYQIKILREEIKEKLGFSCGEVLEVDTVDKYQGKDKSCIIVSFVRHNNEDDIGNILQDWRRINVAITRSKTKLILIGSKRTLKNSEILKRLINFVEKESFTIDWEIF